MIIDGKALSQQVRQRVAQGVERLKQKGTVPGLTVVLVGEDPASVIYVNNKEKACKEIGMNSEIIRLGAEISQQELESTIDRLNADQKVHGILVQMPLPKVFDETAVISRIKPEKDVDGLHMYNSGCLLAGVDAPRSCTPLGIIELIKSTGQSIEGKHAVVIGRSILVGKPVALLLLNENATVTLCHSRTKNLPGLARQADILVAAIGKPGFVTADMVKPGAIVIDVGINRIDGKVKGDVAFDEVAPIASYITPVPGGVGPMTITMLLYNTLKAAGGNV